VIVGSLAMGLGLPVPALVTVDVDPVLAANEPDEEVQDLLRASAGRNLGVDYLPGSLELDPNAFDVDPAFAGRVLWFDAFVANVDRTWRNPNMLFWHGTPYLIDHGAALTFHHNWPSADQAATRPYDATDHVLIGSAPDLTAADQLAITDAVIVDAIDQVPDGWLADEPGFGAPTDVRAAYARFFAARLAARESWLPPLYEAVAAGLRARTSAATERPRQLR
jgi:hypothetical protein